jgi:hypothetical protein
MNIAQNPAEFVAPERADGGLASLSLLLEVAAREGHPDTCKAIAILMAARVANVAPLKFASQSEPGFAVADTLKRRLNLPTIGSARVLATVLRGPNLTFSMDEIAERTASSYKSTLCFVSQLRSHLRRVGMQDMLVGGRSSVILPSPKLVSYVCHWEEVQAFIAVIRDRHLFEHVLRGKLRLASSGESKLLSSLLIAPGDSIGNADLVKTAPCDPGSLLMTISRLRRSLKVAGLDRCIVTLQPNGRQVKAEYGLAPGARALLLETALSPLMSEQLLELYDDLLAPLVTSQTSLRNGRRQSEAAWRRESEAVANVPLATQ